MSRIKRSDFPLLSDEEYEGAKEAGNKAATSFGKFQTEVRKIFRPLWTAWVKSGNTSKAQKAELKAKRLQYNGAMRRDSLFRSYWDARGTSFSSGVSQAWAAVAGKPAASKSPVFNPEALASRLGKRDDLTWAEVADVGVAIYRMLDATQKDRFNKRCDAPVESK